MSNYIYLAILVAGNDEFGLVYELTEDQYNNYEGGLSDSPDLCHYVNSVEASEIDLFKDVVQRGFEPKILWGIIY